MLGLGFGLIFAGYTLFAYGFSQVRSQNAGFIEMVWPGKFSNPAADSGGSTVSQGTPTPATASNPNPKNPIQVQSGGSSVFGVSANPGKGSPANDTPFGAGAKLQSN